MCLESSTHQQSFDEKGNLIMDCKKAHAPTEINSVAPSMRVVPVTAETLLRSQEWYTGKRPQHGVCPGVDAEGKIHSLQIPNLETCTRTEVQNYFDNSWTLTEVLLSGLASPEVFYRVPYHGLRHPLVFYYLHPAVLYVNKLRLAGLIPDAVHADFESLFETGVDEMSWDDMSKNDLSWPSLTDLHKYRKQVYRLISNIIATHPGLADGHAPVRPSDALWTLFMGFEHERIHIETSSVLIRELPIECVRKPDSWPDLLTSPSDVVLFPPKATRDYPANKLVDIEAASVALGKAPETPYFGWDNEYGRRDTQLSKFATSQNLITNGEFYQFVASGGYLEQRFWDEDGWKWRGFRNTKFPTFWKLEGPAGSHRYSLRTCFELIPMQWNWPAIVNFFEAKAYCKWKTEQDKPANAYRLPTEAESKRIRELAGSIGQQSKYNINLAYGAECPVSLNITRESLESSSSTEISDDLVGDPMGNVWQWLEDHFNPLEGFSVNRYYDDFSVPCFDGEHQMISGGSFVSTGDESMPWARFHFRPHFFQHAGFRIVSSESDGGVRRLSQGAANNLQNPYETNTSLSEYLTLHYAPVEVQMPFPFIDSELTQFPQRCGDLVNKWSERLGIASGRALDIGCAVGGATFKLAERFSLVTGVDLSQSFIDAANQLQHGETLSFECRTEGEKSIKLSAQANFDVVQRVEFRRADACSLPAEFVDFDAVLMANLLCRLPSPMSCLSRMSGPRGIVKKGGLLVLTTPFTWMESFTPKELWFGGQKDSEKTSEDALLEIMDADFNLLEKFDMPLLIREHARKYQLISALATVWQRRSA